MPIFTYKELTDKTNTVTQWHKSDSVSKTRHHWFFVNCVNSICWSSSFASLVEQLWYFLPYSIRMSADSKVQRQCSSLKGRSSAKLIRDCQQTCLPAGKLRPSHCSVTCCCCVTHGVTRFSPPAKPSSDQLTHPPILTPDNQFTSLDVTWGVIESVNKMHLSWCALHQHTSPIHSQHFTK